MLPPRLDVGVLVGLLIVRLLLDYHSPRTFRAMFGNSRWSERAGCASTLPIVCDALSAYSTPTLSF